MSDEQQNPVENPTEEPKRGWKKFGLAVSTPVTVKLDDPNTCSCGMTRGVSGETPHQCLRCGDLVPRHI